MYRTILVPFDGSSLSAESLPIATELARRTGATLHLALVHDPSAFIPFVAGEVAVPIADAEAEHAQRAADQHALDEASQNLTAQGIPTVATLLEGAVAPALEAYAAQVAADLTIMTTHGRGGFQRLRLGSIATQYLALATNPVLVVRANDEGQITAFPTGPLVCALDGSPFSEAALPHARAYAAATGTSLHLVSVTVPHALTMAPFGTEAVLMDERAFTAEEEGRRQYLARIAADCPPGTSQAAVTDMSVFRAIIGEVERLKAGTVSLATHGRGGLARFMLGSATDELIRQANVPVLAYRPHTEGH